MICAILHKASSSHLTNGAISSSLEINDVGRCKLMQRKLNSNIIVKIRRIPLTQITTFSIDPWLFVGCWSSVYAWWCLSLWPCLSWFFVLIVGVLWVFYLQWHQLPSRVLLLYLPPPCYHPFYGQWRTSRWKVKTTSTQRADVIVITNFYTEASGRKRRPYSHLSNLTLMKTTRTKMKIKAWRFNMRHKMSTLLP
jgi:hypothetical protein